MFHFPHSAMLECGGTVSFALAIIIPLVTKTTGALVKTKPAEMFARLVGVFFLVTLAIILESTYQITAPVDERISEPFDEDIPVYVIDDVNHSSLYFRHLLRSLAFVDMNIDSIRTSDESGLWFEAVRFFLTLSPTPFIAFSLLLTSIMSIRSIVIVRRPL